MIFSVPRLLSLKDYLGWLPLRLLCNLFLANTKRTSVTTVFSACLVYSSTRPSLGPYNYVQQPVLVCVLFKQLTTVIERAAVGIKYAFCWLQCKLLRVLSATVCLPCFMFLFENHGTCLLLAARYSTFV